jgi:hypothetical protein
LIVIAKAANKWLFPKLFRFAANSQELLFLSALSVCFLFSLFFASLQFSISVGAFVAGVTLANLPYSYEIIGRVKSIRDFFLTLFFVSLGTLLVGIQKNHLIVLGILLAIVWFIKPLITVFITSFFGYKKRTGFLAAVSLTQISEFGLIIATQGMLIGHIQQEIFSIAALLAVITMSATSYFTKYEYFFYSKLQNFLKRFESFSDGQDQLEFSDGKKKYDVLLIGYDRIGYSIVKKLHLLKKELLIVDYNPEVIKRLAREKIHCIYGDISDSEILERINLKGISMVISTSPDKRDNALLIKKAKEANKKIIVFVTSYKVDDAIQLYDAGADYVILPHFLGGEHVSILIETFGNDIRKILRHKFSHIEELKKRQFMGHEQPPVHHTHNVE